jgi:hypothetical protein
MGMTTTEHSDQHGDEQAVLDLLLPRAQARIDGQLHDSDALDSKAFGVLGVAAAAIALLVAAHDDIHRLWWLPAVALGVASLLLLAAVWPRRFDVGPIRVTSTSRWLQARGSRLRGRC